MQSCSDLTPRPLDGIRVIELSQLVAGPLCGATLADLGADVIKVEPPGGEEGRRFGRVHLGNNMTAGFIALNRNKRAVVLDLKSDEGRQALYSLVRNADVFIHNLRPRSIEHLGATWEELSRLNPALIYLSITGFGDKGPYRDKPAVDYVLQAMSGLLSINGFEHQPVRVAVTVIDIASAWLGALGVVSALLHRAHTGQGQHVAVSLFDTALNLQLLPWADYLHSGIPPRRTGNRAGLGAPAALFQTADGYIVISAYFSHQWLRFCRIIGKPEIASDPRFATNELRLAHEEELYDLLDPIIRSRTTQEWLDLLEREDITCARMTTYEEIVQDEQMYINQSIMDIPDRMGRFRTVGFPIRFSVSPMRVTRPAPLLNEHADEVFRR